jgi:membrane protein implicated in regulation of membrane protease activity
MTKNRLWMALAAYAVLALAAVPLHEPKVRLVIWVLMAGLSVKSVVAYLKHRTEE